MTPRERAEALGWVREPWGRWWAPQSSTEWPVALRVDGWGVAFRGCWTTGLHPTEDEALAHALLLRDVVLS